MFRNIFNLVLALTVLVGCGKLKNVDGTEVAEENSGSFQVASSGGSGKASYQTIDVTWSRASGAGCLDWNVKIDLKSGDNKSIELVRQISGENNLSINYFGDGTMFVSGRTYGGRDGVRVKVPNGKVVTAQPRITSCDKKSASTYSRLEMLMDKDVSYMSFGPNFGYFLELNRR